MKKPKQEYRLRRVYVEGYPYGNSATYQRNVDGYRWRTIASRYCKQLEDRGLGPLFVTGKITEYLFNDLTNEGVRCRKVYDMLLGRQGIEFESVDDVSWFMLKYT